MRSPFTVSSFLSFVVVFLSFCPLAAGQYVLTNPGTSQTVTQPSGTSLGVTILEQIRYADHFTGADACAKIASAIADLPSSGGTVDARAFQGPQPCSSIGINKPVRLLLGAATYSWSGPYPLFTISASGVSIEGLGRFQLTVLNAPANTTAIYAAQGTADIAIRHIEISGPVATGSQGCSVSGSTTSGLAIQFDAAFGSNSTFFIEDVYVYGGFSGIQAINPINSSLKDTRVACAASDGFSFVGNGTTVTCINCYSTRNAGNGFTVPGLANVTFVGGETDLAGKDGVYADLYNGSQTVGLTITGLDIEASTGSGIHTNGADGTSVSGSSIINNKGDRIRVSGGHGFVMTGGRLGANTGYGVNAGVLSTQGLASV